MSGSNGFPSSMYARRATGLPPDALGGADGTGAVTVNAAELRDALLGLAGFGAGGLGGSGAGGPDGLERVVRDCGYPRGEWPAALYAGLYDDFGPAARVVELVPRECFQVPPRVYETEDDRNTPFERALRELADGLWGERSWLRGADGEALWGPVLEADVQSGVGRYGVLYVGLDDGLDPALPPRGLREAGSRPLGREEGDEYLAGKGGGKPGGSGGGTAAAGAPRFSVNSPGPPGALPGGPPQFPPYALLRDPAERARLALNAAARPGRGVAFVRPLPEHKAAVSAWEYNPRSPRFGTPAVYALDLSDDGDGGPRGSVSVHWARVVHVVVGDCGGVTPAGSHPRMRQVRPELLDLLKVRGSGAEGYRRNCISGLVFKGEAGFKASPGLKENARNFQAGLDKILVLLGLEPVVPAVTVNDPTPHIQAAISQICIRLGVPRPVWEGHEIGVLASDENQNTWGARKAEYRRRRVGRLVRPVVDRLILLGVLPEPADGYRADWTEPERADPLKAAQVAGARATALSTATGGNVTSVYPPKAVLVDFGGKTGEEADALLKEAEKLAAKAAEEAAAGQEPAPDPGADPATDDEAGDEAAAVPGDETDAAAGGNGSGWAYNGGPDPAAFNAANPHGGQFKKGGGREGAGTADPKAARPRLPAAETSGKARTAGTVPHAGAAAKPAGRPGTTATGPARDATAADAQFLSDLAESLNAEPHPDAAMRTLPAMYKSPYLRAELSGDGPGDDDGPAGNEAPRDGSTSARHLRWVARALLRIDPGYDWAAAVAPGPPSPAGGPGTVPPPVANFNPKQPRDKNGRWLGGGQAHHAAAAKTLIAQHQSSPLGKDDAKKLVDALHGMTVKDLKALAAEHGGAAKGALKADKVQALSEHLAAKYGGPAGSPTAKAQKKALPDPPAFLDPVTGPGNKAKADALKGYAEKGDQAAFDAETTGPSPKLAAYKAELAKAAGFAKPLPKAAPPSPPLPPHPLGGQPPAPGAQVSAALLSQSSKPGEADWTFAGHKFGKGTLTGDKLADRVGLPGDNGGVDFPRTNHHVDGKAHKAWAKSLTQAEQEAVFQWKGSAKQIRKDSVSLAAGTHGPDPYSKAPAMLSALSKHPPQPGVYYRGVSGKGYTDTIVNAALASADSPAGFVFDYAPHGLTPNPKVAGKFSQGDLLMRVTSRSARPIVEVDGFHGKGEHDENEVVGPPGARYRILALRHNVTVNGKLVARLLDMEEI